MENTLIDKTIHMKDKLSGMGGNIVIIVLAIMVILFSWNSLKVVNECKKQPLGVDGGNSSTIIQRNLNIVTTTMGVGTGLIAYTLLGLFIPKLSLILFGVFLIMISIMIIRSYEKLVNSVNCKQKILKDYNMAYGLVGAGIGLVIFSGLSFVMQNIKSPTLKVRIIGIFASLLGLFISSIGISTNKHCNDGDRTGGGKFNTNSIITLIISVLIIVAIAVSFYYYPV